jgi:prevent-host-death family protein
MDRIRAGSKTMKTMSAKDAKNAFGMLIDSARAEPVTIEKHGRKVVVVLAVEEFERLKALEQTKTAEDNKTRKKAVK